MNNLVTTYSDNTVALTMAQLVATVRKLRAEGEFRAPLKAIKLSRQTIYAFQSMLPMVPVAGLVDTFYGIPIETDDSLELFDHKPIYA